MAPSSELILLASAQSSVELAVALQAVRDITTSISSASELSDVLTSTCEAAVQLFGVDHSGLVLFDEHYEQGHVAAEYPARSASQPHP
jgi:GAF domain-containing protein